PAPMVPSPLMPPLRSVQPFIMLRYVPYRDVLADWDVLDPGMLSRLPPCQHRRIVAQCSPHPVFIVALCWRDGNEAGGGEEGPEDDLARDVSGGHGEVSLHSAASAVINASSGVGGSLAAATVSIERSPRSSRSRATRRSAMATYSGLSSIPMASR